MEVKIRGWQRVQGEQSVIRRPVTAMEHRHDEIVIATGTTRSMPNSVVISFRGRATCSPNSNYMFSVELSDADLEELQNIRRRRDDEDPFGLVLP